ncbi:MAG: cupredoxin domain-containing protein [Acidimicrobiales bacterium]
MNEPGGTPTPRRSRGLRAPLVVVAALVSVLVGLGVSVAVVAGIAGGVHVAADQLTSAKAAPVVDHAAVTESMVMQTGKMDGRSGWPRYTNRSWAVHEGETVTLRITSYDDGAAPLTGAQMMFDTVQGTVGGTESVDGKPVSSVPNSDVAHTFTVVGLGLNMPVPAAPTGGSVTVVARFVATRTGTFMWQCYAPCGSGLNAMGGAMSTMGWMEGTVRVLP